MSATEKWFKSFLHYWAENDKKDFLKYLRRLPINRKKYTIMEMIYVNKMQIKQIAYELNTSDRRIKALHAEVIFMALDRLDALKPKEK